MDSFRIGDSISLISNTGRERYAIIHSKTGSTIELKFSDVDSIQSYVVDTIAEKLFMIGARSIFTYKILKYDNELLQNLLNGETVERTVRRMIGRPDISCECETCIRNEIDFLESLVENFPDTIHHNVAALYIKMRMIPNLRYEIIFTRLTDFLNENMEDILQISFDEEQQLDRTVSAENLEKIISSKKSFDCKIHSCEDNCMFCLDEFCKMEGKVNFIECPNCSSKFCTGSDQESNECCRGLKYHLQNDNRCPVCRISATDWVKKLDDIPKKIVPVVYRADLSIEDFVEKPVFKNKMYQIQPDKFIPKKIKKSRYYHRGYSKRQIYGKMQ